MRRRTVKANPPKGKAPESAPSGWGWKAAIATGVVTLLAIIAAAFINPFGNRVAEKWIGPVETPKGLVVHVLWPPDLTCDHKVNVAGLPGTSGLDKLTIPLPDDQYDIVKDLRKLAVEKLGAIIWYRGAIRLDITTASETPAYIVGIEPVVFKRTALAPEWGLEARPPCGGPARNRLFKTVLDYGSLEDLGIPDREVTEAYPGNVPDQPLGKTFTVSQSDPAELLFEIYACNGYFEWGLLVTYITSGVTKTAAVGTAQQPLKAAGGHLGVRRYHAEFDDRGTSVATGPQPPSPGVASTTGPPESAIQVCPT